MNAITIQATVNEVDFPMIQNFFKKLKIETTILDKKEDNTTMTQENFFTMIDDARASKKIKASKKELLDMLYE
ncbi:hypothetical protein HMPREF9075_02708 [Capnocytophaga sp. oral taxon 332 str. F0381]|jgi:hypothetical protein|uniref:hypothetical protein n=1 Tax=Capnocytophaga sp. oral taxon 332 TaxID=712213 RepID=UPI0002A4031C|nr:hypothetical protein [Capnocytophaga sp. oral taxon 332]EKY05089.1 hypothetical protein HMPREF9075_02708 [Capnocytophaga sp. oral taxon 332 str. F0381]